MDLYILMWVKQCHKPPITTYKNGEIGDGL